MRERKGPWWFKKKYNEASGIRRTDDDILAEVGRSLAGILRKGLVPELIRGPEEILLCHPGDHGDAALGICLYDIGENREAAEPGMVLYGSELYQPPKYLDLYYMITAYADSELRYRAETEQRVLGRVMQIFYDIPVLDADTLKPSGKEQVDGRDLRIQFLNLTSEEKRDIWNLSGTPYQLSLFYRITPVELVSKVSVKTKPVSQIMVELRQETRRE